MELPVPFSGHYMEVAFCVPQAARAVLKVGPNMAELLAIVGLREIRPRSVCLNLDRDMAEAGQFEDVQGLLCANERH